jgi:hypothetical protein
LNNPQSAVKRRCILTTPHGPRPCNPATISVSDVPVSDLGLYAHQLALRQTVRVTKLRGLVGLTSWKTGQQLHPHTRLGLRQGAGQLAGYSDRPGSGCRLNWTPLGAPSRGLVSLIRLGWRVDRYSFCPSVRHLAGEQLTCLLLQSHWTPSYQCVDL